jgi:hypothetical protein
MGKRHKANPDMRAHVEMPGWWFPVLAAAFLSSGLPAVGEGTSLFSTFGPGQSFSSNGAGIVGTNVLGLHYSAIAEQFEVSQAANLSSVQVALNWNQGTNALVVRVALDNAGLPGAVLESFRVSATHGFPGTVVTANSTLNPLLASGLTYWLEVLPGDPTTYGDWFSRDPFPNSGSVHLAIDTGAGWGISSTGSGPQAFEISGVVVPEPGSAILLGLGLLAIPAIKRLTPVDR